MVKNIAASVRQKIAQPCSGAPRRLWLGTAPIPYATIIVSFENQDDGLVFDIESVNGIEIKEDTDYTGVRLTGFGNLAKARIPFQIDTCIPLIF